MIIFMFLVKRFRYWFDNTMSRGTPAMIAWLSLLSLTLVIVISSLEVFVDDTKKNSWANALNEIWKNLVDTFHLGGATAGSFPFRTLEVLMALAGIFFASTLVSLITTGVNKRITDLRKGRSAVLETGHTVLLGWSDQVFPILRELMEASGNRRRDCVAILADVDRSVMEEAIRNRLGPTGTMKVVCRSGNPLNHHDLHLVNPGAARSVILITPDGPSPDHRVTRTLLALAHSPVRDHAPYHAVAAVLDGSNLGAAQLAGGHETLVVNADDIASRLIVQTCRQPGLSSVYTDLLDFAGDEIYMTGPAVFSGRTFGDALSAYPTSAVIGLAHRDGRIELAPDPETLLTEDQRLIAISHDDDTLVPLPRQGRVDEAAISRNATSTPGPERTLVLGWNRRAAGILRQLDFYVAPGSEIHVVTDLPGAEGDIGALDPTLTSLAVSAAWGDTASRAVLHSLEVGAYDHVIVLCPDELDPQLADCRTLITLLHLRQLKEAEGHDYSIVSELSDDRNRELAHVIRADDFIVSQRIISLLMVQLAENRDLYEVFAELFDPQGCELYLRPVRDYLVPGTTVDFYTVVEACRRRGHVAVGYRDADGHIHLNPDKAHLVTFLDADRLIVIANEPQTRTPGVPRPRAVAKSPAVR